MNGSRRGQEFEFRIGQESRDAERSQLRSDRPDEHFLGDRAFDREIDQSGAVTVADAVVHDARDLDSGGRAGPLTEHDENRSCAVCEGRDARGTRGGQTVWRPRENDAEAVTDGPDDRRPVFFRVGNRHEAFEGDAAVTDRLDSEVGESDRGAPTRFPYRFDGETQRQTEGPGNRIDTAGHEPAPDQRGQRGVHGKSGDDFRPLHLANLVAQCGYLEHMFECTSRRGH
jgi:hypothetical protein